MENAKYIHRVNFFRPDRHFLFSKKSGLYTTHHIHVIKHKGRIWERYILFRDYLRSNSKALNQYSELKENLQKQFPNDRVAYGKIKEPFIAEIVKRLRLDKGRN